VIYIEGQNKATCGHARHSETMFGTVSLPPTGPIAMKDQRYPLTELGILNLTRRLVEVGEKDKKYGECEVKFYERGQGQQARLHVHRGDSSHRPPQLPSSTSPASSSTRISTCLSATKRMIGRRSRAGTGLDGTVHLSEPEA